MSSKPNKTKPIAEAIARFPYTAPDKRHLSLQKHETLKLIQQHESGWWIGKNDRGNIGFFPSNYVQVTKWLDEESRKKFMGDATDADTTAPAAPNTSSATPDLQWNRPMTLKKAPQKSETDVMMESLGFGADEMEALLSDDDDSEDADDAEDTQRQKKQEPSQSASTDSSVSTNGTIQSAASTPSALDRSLPLRDDVVALEKYNRLNQEMQQLQRDYEVLKRQMKENKQVEIQKRQNKLLQTQIQKLKEEKEKLAQTLEDYRTSTGLVATPSKSQSSTSASSTASSSAVDSEELEKYQSEIASLKKQIVTLNRDLDTERKRSAQASSQQTSAPAPVTTSTPTPSTSGTTIDSKELNALKEQISNLTSQLASKSTELDQLTSDAQEKNEHIEELTTELDDLKKSLEEDKSNSVKAESAQVDKLNKDLTLSKNKLEKQKKLTNDIKKKYADVITKLDADLKKAKKDLEEKTQRLEILEKQSEDTAKLSANFNALLALARQFKKDHRALQDESQAQLKAIKSGMSDFNTHGMKPVFAALKETSDMYKEEAKKRKLLYNELQDLKGKIRICVRVRPVLKSDNSEGTCVKCLTDIGEVRVSDHEAKKTYKYEFDKVFSPKTTQSAVFDEVKGLATSILDGYNVCIFAYGQTGSGKTHTMDGQPNDRGLNYRTIAELFKIQEERRDEFDYTFRVSCTEIYLEQVFDLLAKTKTPLKLQMAGNTTKILDLTKVEVHDAESVLSQFDRSKANRAQACTDMNEHSSRSHAIVSIYVKGINKISGVKYSGKLHLIDLAGSERVKLSGVTGQRMEEAKSINSSLSALGDVISALGAKKPHIPYRNSKLTSVLQDSLGGNSKVLMFVNASPCQEHSGETVCSLKFANRVKKVELGKAVANKTGEAAPKKKA